MQRLAGCKRHCGRRDKEHVGVVQVSLRDNCSHCARVCACFFFFPPYALAHIVLTSMYPVAAKLQPAGTEMSNCSCILKLINQSEV